MTNYREIMRLYWYGLSQRDIAESCNCSKTTVNKVLKRAFETGLRWPLDEEVTNAVIFKKLFGDEKTETNFRMPDYALVHKELAKSGVTLNMLWLEYCHECRLNGEMPYMHTQFYKYYQDYVMREKATMHLEHKPGEKMEVDWCGQVVHIVDSVTATETNAYVFVAVLPCSGYSYVEAFLTRNLNNWINAHIHAYEYFGGVTKLLICDNLKTGVTQASWYTPEINKTYSEMAEHYGTVVIPARAYHPRDKASVEGTVGSVSSFILAALRNNRYYSITEMNIDIRQKLDMFNAKPFQKKPGSRLSAFSDDEHEYLQPLPHSRFEISVWKTAKVQYNYHIAVDRMYYSVPYQYIKHEVSVRVTGSTIEVFDNNDRICSHARLHGNPGKYSTNEEHMPSKHQAFLTWNEERFMKWAASIGQHTEAVVKAILSSNQVVQQGYRTCMALLKLSDKYTPARLNNACKRALSLSASPNYKLIITILKSGQDSLPNETSGKISNKSGYTRGAEYYGGESK